MVYPGDFNDLWIHSRFILQTWIIRISQNSQHLHDHKILASFPSFLFYSKTKALQVFCFSTDQQISTHQYILK